MTDRLTLTDQATNGYMAPKREDDLDRQRPTLLPS